MDKITLRKDGWGEWELYIPTQFAPTPEDAYEGYRPGCDVEELNIIGMYGLTTWDTFHEAIEALNQWYVS